MLTLCCMHGKMLHSALQATAVASLPDPVLWLEPLLIEHGALQELFRAQHNNICVQGGMEGVD